jgi:hypothetical protein
MKQEAVINAHEISDECPQATLTLTLTITFAHQFSPVNY